MSAAAVLAFEPKPPILRIEDVAVIGRRQSVDLAGTEHSAYRAIRGNGERIVLVTISPEHVDAVDRVRFDLECGLTTAPIEASPVPGAITRDGRWLVVTHVAE